MLFFTYAQTVNEISGSNSEETFKSNCSEVISSERLAPLTVKSIFLPVRLSLRASSGELQE